MGADRGGGDGVGKRGPVVKTKWFGGAVTGFSVAVAMRIGSDGRLGPGVAALVLLGFSNLGLGCSPAAKAPSEPAQPAEATAPGAVSFDPEGLALAGIVLEEAAAQSTDLSLELTGVLEADPSATAIVTPRAEGKVVLLTPNVGDRVEAGEVVAVVESEHLHEAQLAHALALKKLSAAEKDLARRRQLARLGAYGRPGLEEARKWETDAASRHDSASAEVRVAESALTEAKSRLLVEDAALEQAEAQSRVAFSRFELVERQWQRSERLLAAQVISKQEHEAAGAARSAASADKARAAVDVRAARARRDERRAAVESAVARHENAKKALATAVKQWDLAKQALERGNKVFQGGFAESKEVAEAETAVALARVEAEGALDDVQLLGGKPGDNHSIPVPAPFSGNVVTRTATLGQTVAAGDPILTIVDSSVLFAQLSVFPSDLPQIALGAKVTVRVPGGSVQGVVERVGETADPKTRAIAVRVRISNPSQRLRPGLPVTATISRPAGRTIVVPTDAIQRLDGRTVVFVPGETSGKFLARDVEAGESSDGKTRIIAGLRAGEKYVARNAFLVKSQLLKSELAEE